MKGPIGWPAPSFIAVSTSRNDATPSSTSFIACAMYGTSSRLTTKPGVSRHSTGVLPTDLTNLKAASTTDCGVVSSFTTSTNAISCTGLK